jgi:hypothetical protein
MAGNSSRRVIKKTHIGGLFLPLSVESGGNGALVLKHPLRHDYLQNSIVVALKKVEYKFYPARHVLKRKTDKGHFQPLLEEVSDFYVTFFAPMPIRSCTASR